VAIERGSDKAKLAAELGAHVYIDGPAEDAALALQRLGGAKVILATASSNRSTGPLVAGLGTRGRLIVAGASLEPIEVDAIALIFGGVRSRAA
jgi:alcohol dehydrogenase, propanol-preferring